MWHRDVHAQQFAGHIFSSDGCFAKGNIDRGRCRELASAWAGYDAFACVLSCQPVGLVADRFNARPGSPVDGVSSVVMCDWYCGRRASRVSGRSVCLFVGRSQAMQWFHGYVSYGRACRGQVCMSSPVCVVQLFAKLGHLCLDSASACKLRT